MRVRETFASAAISEIVNSLNGYEANLLNKAVTIACFDLKAVLFIITDFLQKKSNINVNMSPLSPKSFYIA